MTAQHIHRAPERICTCCGKSLAAGEFYAAPRGVRNICRKCMTAATLERYHASKLRYAEPKPEGAALARTPTHVGTYDGAELRPYTGRPGALDAYRIPSRGIG